MGRDEAIVLILGFSASAQIACAYGLHRIARAQEWRARLQKENNAKMMATMQEFKGVAQQANPPRVDPEAFFRS